MTDMPKMEARSSNLRKPKIKKGFPWGWLLLAVLVLTGAGMVVLAKNAPHSLSMTHPALFKAGERKPILTASGYIVARHRATVSSKVPGRLSELMVEEGSQVQKGQLLARLEATDTEASRKQVEVNLAQAELDLQRAEALVRDGVLDKASLDRLKANRDALKENLRYIDALLENMVIRAPFAGTVTQKLSEVGETVSPGSAGGANAINAMVVLVDFNTLEVEVEVNESGITKLRKGQPAEILVDALGEKPLKGELREIYPTSNRQKAVVVVRVKFQEKHPNLLPDMGAKVSFLDEPYAQDVLVIGREQIVRRKGQPHVWLLDKGVALLKPVQLGEELPVGYEVKGLPADAPLLIVTGELKLQEGAKVKIKE